MAQTARSENGVPSFSFCFNRRFSSEELASSFQTYGLVVLRDFFSREKLASFQKTLVHLFHLQGMKIGEYRQLLQAAIQSESDDGKRLSKINEILEPRDKEALYQVQKMLPSSLGLKSLFWDESFQSVCRSLLGSEEATCLLDGPALFVNRPRTERLLYKWHSEAHYYPKRRRFLNIWFPLFDSKSEHNGAMSVKLGSHHLHDVPFAEYRGYNKDSQDKANYFIQYEVPENFVAGLPEFYTEASPGDLVIFHRKLIHRSNPNFSDEYSFAGVARVWDPSQDLTLAGNLAVTPYGGDIGRPDLVVAAETEIPTETTKGTFVNSCPEVLHES